MVGGVEEVLQDCRVEGGGGVYINGISPYFPFSFFLSFLLSECADGGSRQWKNGEGGGSRNSGVGAAAATINLESAKGNVLLEDSEGALLGLGVEMGWGWGGWLGVRLLAE